VIASFLNSPPPSWTCFIDGNALVPGGFPSPSLLNGAQICSFYNIHNTPTTRPFNLTVVASGTSDNPFLFDRIEYTPDASVPLDNATVKVDSSYDQIHYSSGWSTNSPKRTSEKGSSLTFDFIGIQITWITQVASTVNSSAEYSIDNGIQFPFMVAPQSGFGVAFQSPVLSPGLHRLFVQYNGGNPDGSTPLILDYFLVQNLTIPSFTPSPSPTITKTDSPVSGKLSAGALSGIVIGSLVGGALIVLGLIWVIRFTKQKSAADSLRRQPAWYKAYGDGQDT